MNPILKALLTLTVFAALVIVATTSKRNVRTVYAQSGCNVATLTGNYGFTFSGFSPHPPQYRGSNRFPFSGEGLGIFDGGGNFSATFASSLNGTSSTGNPYTATYTVNSDCTGLLTATPGSGGDNFAFVIVGGGAEILGTDLSGTTLSLDLKKQ